MNNDDVLAFQAELFRRSDRGGKTATEQQPATEQKPGGPWEPAKKGRLVLGEKTPITSGGIAGTDPPAVRWSRPRSPAQWRKILAHLNGGKAYSPKNWQNLRKGVLAKYLKPHPLKRNYYSLRLDCTYLPVDFEDAAN